MTISDDVFRSILAMDSYNRGYGAGILLSGTEIGDAALGDSTNEDASAQAASFYAQAYIWGDKTVISYRGTDQDLTLEMPGMYGHATGSPRGI
jgi:hypothetical protein